MQATGDGTFRGAKLLWRLCNASFLTQKSILRTSGPPLLCQKLEFWLWEELLLLFSTILPSKAGSYTARRGEKAGSAYTFEGIFDFI